MQVSLNNVSKHWKSTGQVLQGIDLTLQDGEFLSLLGPSGCGKSTLLRLIAGLDTPTEGEIEVEGAERAMEQAVGVVFQDPRLLPWRSAEANVRLPLELTSWPKAERQARIDQVLDMVGLSKYHTVHPGELSGGMKMRVSLARALVTSPELLLLDEPFGALDEITRQTLNDELLRLWVEHSWTALFVTHNIVEAVFLSQRVALMGRHPGTIQHVVSVPFEYPRSPELRTTAEFGAIVAELMAQLERVSQ